MGVPSKVRKTDEDVKLRYLPGEEVRNLESGAETARETIRGSQYCSAVALKKKVYISHSVAATDLPSRFPSKDPEHQSTKLIEGNEVKPGKRMAFPQEEVPSTGILMADLTSSEGVQASNGKSEDVAHDSTCSSSLSQKCQATSSTGIILHAGTKYNHAKAAECHEEQIKCTIQKNPQNGPALKVIWKGNFEIQDCPLDVGFCEGVIAHPSAKVSRKAYSFSKQMAGVLKFMIYAQCNFWPDIFQVNRPDRNDIALYFYPGNYEKSKRQYRVLLKFMERKSLMLRSRMGNIELLVFPSTLLEPESQKLGGSYFLWGVFHCIKGSTSTCYAVSQSSSVAAVA